MSCADIVITYSSLASDIELDADIEILNPEQVIATLVEGGSINMEMTIGSGRGYTRAEDNKKLMADKMKGPRKGPFIYCLLQDYFATKWKCEPKRSNAALSNSSRASGCAMLIISFALS